METKTFPKPAGWEPCVKIMYGLPVMVTDAEIAVPLPIIDKLIADGLIEQGDTHGMEGRTTATSDGGSGPGDAGIPGAGPGVP